MLRFQIPEVMKLACIWVLWACFAIGTIGWCLLVVLRGVGIEDKSGWVQAFGAIIAIVGAAFFPYWHEEHKAKLKAQQLRNLLSFLVKYQGIMLNTLEDTMRASLTDPQGTEVYTYVLQGRHLEWDSHIAALNAVPIAEIRAMYVMLLGDMKVSAAVGKMMCERMRDPTLCSPLQQMDLAILRARIQVTKTACEVISPDEKFT